MLESLLRWRPASFRRLGPVIGVLGPDGAGKGTVIELVQRELPIAVTSVYLGAQKKTKTRVGDGMPVRYGKHATALRELAFVMKKYVRAGWVLGRGYLAAWRGHVVLCDRHPIDTLVVRPKRHTRMATRLELILVRLLPVPDRIVVLDAPGDVLYKRKPEHPVDRLEEWRRGYREILASHGADFLLTTGTIEQTGRAASSVIWQALALRRRW